MTESELHQHGQIAGRLALKVADTSASSACEAGTYFQGLSKLFYPLLKMVKQLHKNVTYLPSPTYNFIMNLPISVCILTLATKL